MNFIHEIKDAVIRIGLNSKIENMNELYPLMDLESFYYWGDMFMTARLNGSELLNYFKGLVIIEKAIGSCGSTTPAARAYWEIENRNLDADHLLADWAIQYSDNEYIPFGTASGGSAARYYQSRKELEQKRYKEKIDKEERKRLQLERAEKIEKEKIERDNQRRQLYQKIMEMPPKDQVDTLLSDVNHILYFYMPVINGLLHNNSITSQDLGKLGSRLKTMKKTPFNKKLIKQIEKKRMHLFFHPNPEYTNSEETLQKLALIENEVDRKVNDLLKDHPRTLGFCHLFWGTKKRLLKEEYGIDWLTPAECHPDVKFD